MKQGTEGKNNSRENFKIKNILLFLLCWRRSSRDGNIQNVNFVILSHLHVYIKEGKQKQLNKMTFYQSDFWFAYDDKENLRI